VSDADRSRRCRANSQPAASPRAARASDRNRANGPAREKKAERDEEDKDKNWRVVVRSYGSFSRTISLPFDPEPAKVEAKFDKGVLHIHLPKPAEVAKKQQKIEVKRA
jgi:hypothetical protein